MTENAIPRIGIHSVGTQNQAIQPDKAVNRNEGPQFDQALQQASPYSKEIGQDTQKSKKTSTSTNNQDVHLKFQVDADTNEITILVLDKVSRQVIRTIPQDELQNLRAGDLFELFL